MPKATTVEIICGPMFAGKTSMCVSKGATIADVNKGKCMFLAHSSDCRPEITNDLGVSTHSCIKLLPENFIVIKTSRLMDTFETCDIEDSCPVVSVVIDEAQFFDPEDLEAFVRLVVSLRLMSHVFIGGLDGTGSQGMFTDWVSRVLPVCTSIVKLSAVCVAPTEGGEMCGGVALFTKRVKGAPEGDVGGAERWMAVCKEHSPSHILY